MLTLTFFLKCLNSEQGSVLLFLITFLHIWSMCGLMEESLFFASHQYLLVCSDVILLFCYKTLFRRFCASISEIKHSVTFRHVFLQMCLCLFFFFKKKTWLLQWWFLFCCCFFFLRIFSTPWAPVSSSVCLSSPSVRIISHISPSWTAPDVSSLHFCCLFLPVSAQVSRIPVTTVL